MAALEAEDKAHSRGIYAYVVSFTSEFWLLQGMLAAEFDFVECADYGVSLGFSSTTLQGRCGNIHMHISALAHSYEALAVQFPLYDQFVRPTLPCTLID